MLAPDPIFILKGLPEKYHAEVRLNATLNAQGFFPDITEDDEKDYRQWARENYQPERLITSTWHPVTVDECIKIIKEFISD